MNRELPAPDSIARVAPYADATLEHAGEAPLRQSLRAKLFTLTFGFVLAIGCIVTALQPAEYRAAATVLMSAPVAVDDEEQEANVQSVAIQRRILLGGEVTNALLNTLGQDRYSQLDSHYLREVLRVDPVADTNLVEMIAQGEDDELLPELVNTWIDVYMEVRANGIAQSQQHTLDLVRAQLEDLRTTLTQARKNLANYREEHDISSAERQENAVMSRLEGLNKALNTAVEEEAKARATLQSMNDAIARGKKIIPVSDRDSVAGMEKDLRKQQMQLKNLSKNFTMEYIAKQPKLRDIPERIAELESQLEEMYEEGQQIELSIARQKHDAAQQTVATLQEKLQVHKGNAAAFTTVYATHESLVEDLARLEDLNRETQARLVEVQVSAVDKYPQVEVIDRPAQESIRLGPDYLLWLGGSALAAFLMGVLSVWLHSFLSPKTASPAYVTLSGVHMYPQDVQGALPYQAAQNAALGQTSAPLLGNEESRDTTTDNAPDTLNEAPGDDDEPKTPG